MIEEKTKEPQSQAPAAPVKGREKLRSFWAKVQISGLLRRHRFRRKTQRHMNDVAKKLRASAVVLAVGEALYTLGFAAEYQQVVAQLPPAWGRGTTHTSSQPYCSAASRSMIMARFRCSQHCAASQMPR